MKVQPYLFFNGRCEEAAEFYKKALGAEVTALMRFKESPEPSMTPPGSAEKIMHMSMRIGESTVLASDGMCAGEVNFQGVSMALLASSDSEAKRWFDALSDGGQVQMALTKTFFSSSFGMVADKFGVAWMIVVE